MIIFLIVACAYFAWATLARYLHNGETAYLLFGVMFIVILLFAIRKRNG